MDGLGDFLELKTVVETPDALPTAMAHLERLLSRLGLGPADLVDRSYGDLLA